MSFGQDINKIIIKKFDIFEIFKTKHGLNRIKPSITSQQMEWFDGKKDGMHF